MSRSYRYRVLDVFTTNALEGNPLAVFPEANGMDGTTMQRIARELNLSETVFVLPPTRSDCVRRARIFTPTREMLFAGHPTIGTSFVLLDEGIVGRDGDAFALEEIIGPIPVRIERGERPMLWLRTPPIRDGAKADRKRCAQLLGVDERDLLDAPPQLLDAGNPTLFVALRDKEAVDRASMDLAGIVELRGSESTAMCVFVFTPTPEGAYSRMFAAEYGIIEDPATGSSTGPLAAYMMRHGLAPSADGTRFVSEQGTQMGRRSLLHVFIHGEQGAEAIEVGGHVTPLVSATMEVPLMES